MDLVDSILSLAQKAVEQADQFQSTETTKNGLVLPFLKALGYDVFDPSQVRPGPPAQEAESERVDYLILKDGRTAFMVEVRPACETLGDPISSRIYWSFGSTDVRLAVLTNGIQYRFFTDLDAGGQMDASPFLVFDLKDYKERDLEELRRFSRPAFQAEAILATAREQRLSRELHALLGEQMNTPSPAFLQALAELVHVGPLEGAALESFGRIVRKAFQQLVNDRIQDRLKATFSFDEPQVTPPDVPIVRTRSMGTRNLSAQGGVSGDRGPTTRPLPDEDEDDRRTVGWDEGGIHLDPEDGVPVPTDLQAAHGAGGRKALLALLAVAVAVAALYFWKRSMDRRAPRIIPSVQVAAGSATAVPGPASSSMAAGVPVPAAEPATDPSQAFRAALGQGDLTGASRAWEARRAALSKDRWVVRVAIACEASTVSALLATLGERSSTVFLYPMDLKDGRGCQQVLLGDFGTEVEARQAAAALPASVTAKGNAPKLIKVADIPSRQVP